MVFEVNIDDKTLDLINKGYQHSDIGRTKYECVMTMKESIEKMAKGLGTCKNCRKVFREVFKGQFYCSVECQKEYRDREQPDLPFPEDTED